MHHHSTTIITTTSHPTMAKLIILAFTIATLLAFTSAHRTIVTTTIEEDDTFDINPSPKKQQCSQRLESQQFQQCQTYLQQPHQQQTLQQCCQELRKIEEPCVCKAVKKTFGVVQQQQQQEAGPFGLQQLKEKAEKLPKFCNIPAKKQCSVKTVKQCRKQVEGRKLNRCQMYLEQQTGPGYLMGTIWKKKPAGGLEQCCEEFKNVDVECQCEAMKEVYSKTQKMGEFESMVENLKNKCNLEVEQCQIPSRMFYKE